MLFTTEHGIAFPRAKGTCHGPGIEAFLLMRYPPLIDGGTDYEELVSNVDIMPTVLDLTIGETPADIDGYSLVPLLDDDQTYSPRDHVFAEITWYGTYNPIRAVRTERFKYIRNFWHNPRYFSPTMSTRPWSGVRSGAVTGGYRGCTKNCTTSRLTPHERENVADDADYEQVRTKFESTLTTWMHETDDPTLDGPVRPDDYDRMFDGVD